MNAPFDGNDASVPTRASGITRKQLIKRGAASAGLLLGGSQIAGALGGIATASAASKGVHLTMLNWHTSTPKVGLGEGYIAAGKLYEKTFPGNTITFQASPYATYVPHVTSAFRANDLPPVAAYQPGGLDSAIYPALKPFSKKAVVPQNDLTKLSGWLLTELNVGRAQTYVGIPAFGQGLCFYYNKALFSQAGLDPSKPPITFAQFADVCDALVAKGIAPLSTANKDGSTPNLMAQAWIPQFAPTDQDVANFAIGKTDFNNPGTVATLNAIAETFTRGWWQPNFADLTLADTTSDFSNGKVAMCIGALTDILNWNVWDTSPLGKNGYGVFVAPLLPGAKVKIAPFYFAPAILLGVTQDAKSLAPAAMQFIEWLASAPAQQVVLANGGTWPNRADVNVRAATKSPGAVAINDLIKKHGTQGNQFSFLNTAASAASGKLMGQAVTTGGVAAFITQISALQDNSTS